MAYIEKHSLLMAYKVLSHNTPTPSSQGTTQFVSAIRYLFALDKFTNKHGSGCDTKDKNDKEAFVQYVGDVVSVDGPCYTSNFYTDLKTESDFKVGSNFFSVNVVKESVTDKSKIFDFPRRAKDGELFHVQNGTLSIVTSYFKHLRKYIPSKKCRVAFAIWLCRKYNFPNVIDYQSIYGYLKSVYSIDLINVLLNESDYNEYIVEFGGIETSLETSVINENDIKNLFKNDSDSRPHNMNNSKYRPYITAIKSKPFLLLAGISGTGKSRIVRELARACWEVGSEEYKAQKPRNFEMVQVKPNWHDSTELIGYVSRVSGTPEFIPGPFLKFVARAWEDLETPYFLCLDEMNLAPVEQYFAEYLSVVESRKKKGSEVVTDPILTVVDEQWFFDLAEKITNNEAIRQQFIKNGICLPQNLIVVGTVNMDETTFSFSRKVLDRAMTIEMNDVDLKAGLEEEHENIGLLTKDDLIGIDVEGKDVYGDNKEVCDNVIAFLQAVNDKLEHTPFKIAYRTRNEFLLYVVNNLVYDKDKDGNKVDQDYIIAKALDEITSMKILSRIEGDESKVSKSFLENLCNVIKENLVELKDENGDFKSISLDKLKEMEDRLQSGYTSFWN